VYPSWRELRTGLQMIPDLVDINGVWEALPPGIHSATLADVADRFAADAFRKHLFQGFQKGVEDLRVAGCRTVFLDGSYVTAKGVPGDFDACWDGTGVDCTKLEPTLRDFDDSRKNQKARYGGEFFPAHWLADGVLTYLEYFQIDRFTGNPKGIIRISLV
jgi:hypothetical protein